MITIKDLSNEVKIECLKGIMKDIIYYKETKRTEEYKEELECMSYYCQLFDEDKITKKYMDKPLTFANIQHMYNDIIKYLENNQEDKQ